MRLNIKNFIFPTMAKFLTLSLMAWGVGPDEELDRQISLRYEEFRTRPDPNIDSLPKNICPAVHFLTSLTKSFLYPPSDEKTLTTRMIKAILYRCAGVGGISDRLASPAEAFEMKYAILGVTSEEYSVSSPISFTEQIDDMSHQETVMELARQFYELIQASDRTLLPLPNHYFQSQDFTTWAAIHKQKDQQLIQAYRRRVSFRANCSFLQKFYSYQITFLEHNPDVFGNLEEKDICIALESIAETSPEVLEVFQKFKASMNDSLRLAVIPSMTSYSSEQLEKRLTLIVPHTVLLQGLSYVEINHLLPVI